MFQRNSINKKKKRKKILLFWRNILKLLIILFLLIIYKKYFSIFIKNHFNIKITINELEQYIPILQEVYFILFNKYQLQIVIPLLLVYNFCNIYKTFILLISLLIPLMISQILNLYLINSINNKNELNNELLYTTGYTLILWEILFNSDTNDKIHHSFRSVDSLKISPNNNKYSLLYAIIFILSAYFINYIIFKDIEKIIFDLISGLTLHHALFKIFEIVPNNPRQFQRFVEFEFFYFILIVFTINIFVTIYSINIFNENKAKEEIIKYIIYKFSFSNIIVGMYFGSKYEYNCYFEKKFNNWAQYNFEYDGEILEEEESLASSISFNKARQWNHTNFSISLIRLLILIFLSFGCLYTYIFVNFQNFLFELFLKYIIPLNIFTFGLFHLFKLILKYLKVTNILLLTIIGERESF